METCDLEESLARTRPRRSTAGNRMAQALAEFASVEPEIEQEDDKEFADLKDEEEIFDSDFQSTDEEEANELETAAEKEVQIEENLERKAHRNRVAKNTEVAAARQRVSKQSVERPGQSKGRMTPKARRVSLGFTLDAETGDIIEAASKRKSRRHSTMLSSQILHSRLKDAEQRRASMTQKRSKESVYVFSQAELIARALDTEEGNIIEHRDYLSQEEEKRARARVVRKSVSGPVLRWMSRMEDEGAQPTTSSKPHLVITPEHVHPISQKDTWMSAEYPNLPSEQSVSNFNRAIDQKTKASSPFPQLAKEKICKNYLVHEVDQQPGARRPFWGETMSCVFGSHVKWEEVKAYLGKHRPITRPFTRCPLTGKSAIYRDPRSGVPYANANAFKTLTRLLSHAYVWNENLKCYTVEGSDVC